MVQLGYGHRPIRMAPVIIFALVFIRVFVHVIFCQSVPGLQKNGLVLHFPEHISKKRATTANIVDPTTALNVHRRQKLISNNCVEMIQIATLICLTVDMVMAIYAELLLSIIVLVLGVGARRKLRQFR